jgi:PKD repeat protein
MQLFSFAAYLVYKPINLKLMKTAFTKISIALFFLLIMQTGKSSAQCQADFSWVQTTANVISFTDLSTGSSFDTLWRWDFGDGNSEYIQNPVHTFNVPGTYYVCLTITDSTGCNSTFCDSVTVTGIVICNVTTQAVVQSHASCVSCADGVAYAWAYGGTAPYTYSWSSGDTGAVVTGLLPGTYTVCATDANGCTACFNSVNVVYSTCTADFTWNQSSPNVIDFTSTSTGVTGNTEYIWEFGDNTWAYQMNPTHTYTIPGNYYVCIYISDTASSNYCQDSTCYSITVTGSVICNLSINAFQASPASCWNCADGTAYAMDSVGNTNYSWLWSNGDTTAYVTGLLPGVYTVCATDTNGCTDCASVTIDSVGCYAFFQLYPDTTMPSTYIGYNMSGGIPPITYLWSWGDGNYDYTAYPTHTYAGPGFYNICLTISDSSGCNSTYCDSTYLSVMNDEGRSSSAVTVIIQPISTGVPGIAASHAVSVFPNPVQNQLTIRGSMVSSVEMYSAIGTKVVSMRAIDAREELRVDVSLLSPGIYFLQVQSAGKIFSQKIIKQ